MNAVVAPSTYRQSHHDGGRLVEPISVQSNCGSARPDDGLVRPDDGSVRSDDGSVRSDDGSVRPAHDSAQPAHDSAQPNDEAASCHGDLASHHGLVQRDDAPDLVQRLEDLARRAREIEGDLVSAVADLIRECDKPGDPQNYAQQRGWRSAVALVEGVTGVSGRTARNLVRTAERTSASISLTGQPIEPSFPHVGTAMREGTLNLETASVIISTLTPAMSRSHPDDFDIAERSLVEMATGGIEEGPGAHMRHACDLVGDAAKVWRDRIDQDGVEPRADLAHHKRSLWVSRRGINGLHKVAGHVPTDLAMRFHALRDAMVKKPDPSQNDAVSLELASAGDGRADGIGSAGDGRADGIGSAGDAFIDDGAITDAGPVDGDTRLVDARSIEQLGADLFAAMMTSYASSDAFSVPPAVIVTIAGTPDGAINAAAGRIQNEPAPRSMVDQIACNGGMQPAWRDITGRLVAMGVSSRAFTAQQRRAIAARDGTTCLIPHCTIPATSCEAHHVIPWAQDGPTHVDNGVLLCWSHHRMMDHDYWNITMHNGVPVISRPGYYRRL